MIIDYYVKFDKENFIAAEIEFRKGGISRVTCNPLLGQKSK